MKFKHGMLMTIVLFVAVAGMAMAADNGAAEKEKYTGTDPSTEHSHMFGDADWLEKFHHPAEGVTLGLDVRIREVYGANIRTLNHSGANNYTNYGRYRTRLSAKFELDPDIDLNTRLTWEFFSHSHPGENTVDFDEMIFDRMNLTMRNVFDMPLTVVVGRQDIILGTGWLVLDGNPGDGSRTIFFDAVRATYDMADADTKLDLIYIQNYDAEDKWLNPINHREHRHLTQGQDERGAILYITNNSTDTQVEGYYIYKEARRSVKFGSTAPNAEIHTIGGALSGQLDANWKYRAELAKQFGRKGQTDLNALGFNGRLAYSFNDEYSSGLHFDYEYLSGDNPDSSDNEAFDPLWGDYPHFDRGGDLPIYVAVGETGNLGEMTNFHRLGFGHTFKPADKWTLETMYNLYWADENTQKRNATTAAGPNYSTDGNFRGQMFTAYLKYRCCKQLSAHFLVDYFVPGTFYETNSRDHALFARFNLEYAF